MVTQMNDRNPSPASSSSSTAAVAYKDRRLRQHVVEEDGGDPVACTGKSCQSCTAGVIADCVAVCCCPCAVVDILALAFVKLPWAVARKCIGWRKGKSRRRIQEDKKRKCWGEDMDGISERRGVDEGISGSESAGIGELEELNDNLSAEFEANEVWLELYEVGHMSFGRVSFTGLQFKDRGN